MSFSAGIPAPEYVLSPAEPRGEAVQGPLQPAADGLLGEGIDRQRNGRGGKGPLGTVPKGQEFGQRRECQAVHLQRQRDQPRVDERGSDEDANAEEVGGKDRVGNSHEEQDGGQWSGVDEAEVAGAEGQNDVCGDADQSRGEDAASDQPQLRPPSGQGTGH